MLKLANLVEKREGPIHYIYTREELQAETESKKKERILTKVYKLNYIRADELMIMIRPFLSEDVGQKRIQSTANYHVRDQRIADLRHRAGCRRRRCRRWRRAVGGGGAAVAAVAAAQRGIQPVDRRPSMAGSDVLVIQDYESNLKIIDQIIERLDVQPVQVLIEAVIISVELDKDKQLGVNFGVVDNLGQELGTIGSGAALNGNVGFTPASVLTAAGKIAAGTAADPTGLRLGHQRHQVRLRLQQRDGLHPGPGDHGEHQGPGQPPDPGPEQAARRDPARRSGWASGHCRRTSPARSSGPVPEHRDAPAAASVRLQRRHGPDGDPSRAEHGRRAATTCPTRRPPS